MTANSRSTRPQISNPVSEGNGSRRTEGRTTNHSSSDPPSSDVSSSRPRESRPGTQITSVTSQNIPESQCSRSRSRTRSRSQHRSRSSSDSRERSRSRRRSKARGKRRARPVEDELFDSPRPPPRKKKQVVDNSPETTPPSSPPRMRRGRRAQGERGPSEPPDSSSSPSHPSRSSNPSRSTNSSDANVARTRATNANGSNPPAPPGVHGPNPPPQGVPDDSGNESDTPEGRKLAAEKLADAITTRDSRLLSVYNQRLAPCRKCGRMMHRIISPFESITSNFEIALCLDSSLPFAQQDLDESLKNLDEATFIKTIKINKAICAMCPRLPKARRLLKDEPEVFMQLCKYAGSARRDDISRLRGIVHTLIPNYRGPLDLPKADRGWHHLCTARMLCPQNKLMEFERNWDEFSDDVLATRVRISTCDLPSFLWDQDAVVQGDRLAGLLRGSLILKSFRSVFTGPRTVKRKVVGLAPGKPCIATMFDIKPYMAFCIAYICVLVRFALNSQDTWSSEDGDFNAIVFFNTIVNLLESDSPNGQEWRKSTLDWWHLQVFNTKPVELRGALENSVLAEIEAQMAATA
ncbi:hypothetical protein QCA50_014141 [Cerrena zonata]|uniref:Uncharacterized protein n=1 Tax=Cerrena zonata TaxID=2478898 RepID=A0AAW0FYP2_9APHY